MLSRLEEVLEGGSVGGIEDGLDSWAEGMPPGGKSTDMPTEVVVVSGDADELSPVGTTDGVAGPKHDAKCWFSMIAFSDTIEVIQLCPHCAHAMAMRQFWVAKSTGGTIQLVLKS